MTDGGTSQALAKSANKLSPEAARLEETRRANAEAARKRQELAAQYVDGGEREALAKGRDAADPHPLAPPTTLDTQPGAGLGADGVPLRANGKPHTDDPAKVAPLTGKQLPSATPGALAGEKQPVAPKVEAPKQSTYVVQEGDTLYRIVRRTYGEGDTQKMFDLVLQANPSMDPDLIMAGQKIILPALPVASQLVTPSPEQQVVTDESVILYEVLEGDTLSSIASAELGTGNRWKEIYDLNRRRLLNPDRVLPGMTLVLPKK